MSEMGQAMMGTGESVGDDRAREAAETAIHSPLLEDINLQGARGILVNITAGPDLSLGEFSDVGDTVEAFSSDNATVVVGTVIDPEMGDKLRVTVVATGLGQTVERKQPTKVVDNTSTAVAGALKSSGEMDYEALEKPTIIRREPRGSEAVARKLDARTDPDMDYLDIPAFLRRQAD
jgi:cell division protein FtsZ